MDTFTKHEAAEALGVTVRTLSRWMKTGKLRGTKQGTEQYSPVTFTRAELEAIGPLWPVLTAEPTCTNLVQEQPEPCRTESVQRPQPEPEPERPLTDSEQRIADDLEFSEKYRAGEVTDSCGNRIDGTNDRFLSGRTSLLGPMEPAHPVRVGTADHMDQRLLPTPGPAANDLMPDAIPIRRRPRHPNFTRQALLTAILSDIRAGYSR